MTLRCVISRSLVRWPLLVVPSALSFAAIDTAQAAWETVPDLNLFVGANDNVLLNKDDKVSASSMTADLGVEFAKLAERGKLVLSPRILADAYPDKAAQAYETVDKFFDANGNYDWQRVGIGFTTHYSDEIFIHSEFAPLTPSDPNADPGRDVTDIDPSTGRLTFYDNTRKRLDYSGNLDFRFTQRNQFSFDFYRQDTSYSGTQNAAQRDFVYTEGGMSLTRNIDPRNRVSARLAVSEFTSPANDNTTNTVAISGSFSRPLTQTWNIYLSAGVERSEYKYVNTTQTQVTNADTSPQFALGFRKRAERTSWNLDFTSTQQAGGSGYIDKRREFRAYISRDFSQRLNATFGARIARLTNLSNATAEDDRDYKRVGIDFDYALKQTLALTFGYEYLDTSFYNDVIATGASNTLYIGVSYHGKSRR
jgi:hypothetical protein